MGKKRKKSGNWTPQKGASKFFKASSDYYFKKKHPIGYGFVVMLGMFALLLPVTVYLYFVTPYNNDSLWLILGWIGGFVIGIGLFNIVAIIMKQYLGHLVSILSFIIGGILIWISLIQMGIV